MSGKCVVEVGVTKMGVEEVGGADIGVDVILVFSFTV